MHHQQHLNQHMLPYNTSYTIITHTKTTKTNKSKGELTKENFHRTTFIKLYTHPDCQSQANPFHVPKSYMENKQVLLPPSNNHRVCHSLITTSDLSYAPTPLGKAFPPTFHKTYKQKLYLLAKAFGQSTLTKLMSNLTVERNSFT